jgi:HEAT repeat protein
MSISTWWQLRKLASNDKYTRVNAARALSGNNDPKIIDAFHYALADRDLDVRRAVAYPLAASGDPSGSDILMTDLQHGTLRDSALPLLLHLRELGWTPDVVSRCVIALVAGRFQEAAEEGDVALPVFWRYVNWQLCQIVDKYRAIDAIASIRTTAAARLIVRMMAEGKHQELSEDMGCQEALAQIGTQAIPVLLELLKQKHTAVVAIRPFELILSNKPEILDVSTLKMLSNANSLGALSMPAGADVALGVDTTNLSQLAARELQRRHTG